jgi:hypothetical protein
MGYTDDDSFRCCDDRIEEETKMGQLIEYYIPTIFIPRQPRWTDLQQRGRILEFQKAGVKKSA